MFNQVFFSSSFSILTNSFYEIIVYVSNKYCGTIEYLMMDSSEFGCYPKQITMGIRNSYKKKVAHLVLKRNIL